MPEWLSPIVYAFVGAVIALAGQLLLHRGTVGTDELFKRRIDSYLRIIEIQWQYLTPHMIGNFVQAMQQAHPEAGRPPELERVVTENVDTLKAMTFMSDRTLRVFFDEWLKMFQLALGQDPKVVLARLRGEIPEEVFESMAAMTRAMREDLGVGRLSPLDLWPKAEDATTPSSDTSPSGRSGGGR